MTVFLRSHFFFLLQLVLFCCSVASALGVVLVEATAAVAANLEVDVLVSIAAAAFGATALEVAVAVQ